MLNLPRFATHYLAFSYLLISAVPYFSWVLGKPMPHGVSIFFYELAAWFVIWALLKRPRWFQFLLLPAFFAIPIEIYLRLYYGQGISTHHLGIITETSPKEAIEFLGNKFWLLMLISIIIGAWWWSLLRAAKSTRDLDWDHVSRWAAIVLIVLASGAWCYGLLVGVAEAPAESNSAGDASPSSSAIAATTTQEHIKLSAIRSLSDAQAFFADHAPLPKWAAVFYDEENFSRTWPLGIFVRAADYFHERHFLTKLRESSKNFRFNARQATGNDFQQTIVMVIGESSRFDRWSLNGYTRETNPLLSKETNIVSFSNMISAVAATRLSVPIISTRKPATQSLKPGFTETSFISAYKEAGFKTYWISNQMSFGQFDTPTSVIAKEADVTQFLNLGGFTNNSDYDQVLLNPLNVALQDGAPNKLIVLHTLGNHWNYSHRHPQNFDRWQPSLFGVSNPAYTNLKNKEALNNSYDNSILYTDWMLEQVISFLKKTPHMTALVYVSDHGQTLYDGSCNLAFHGHNTDYEFHIPAFVWYSQQYAEQHPDKITQLIRHKDAKLSTENVFHSLLDMVDIRYPDEHLEWSVFNEKLKNHTRYVDSYGWSNYDDASLKGDCHEVIDHKTPLPQDK